MNCRIRKILVCLYSIIVYGNEESMNDLPKSPRLSLIIVIDQFANHELLRIVPFLQGGIKDLYENGIRYRNTFHPHAMPETGVGHATLSTGTVAHAHGIIANFWYNPQGEKVICDEASPEKAGVFSPDGMYDYGVSPHNIMVDGLSDQIMLYSSDKQPTKVYSLALKSRAASFMASRLGKAIWFDEKTGFFTSSKQYFAELPAWVKKFNKQNKINELNEFTWELFHPHDSVFYKKLKITDAYDLTATGSTMIGSTPIDRSEKLPFLSFERTPLANKLLLNLAQQCIKQNLTADNRLILWLGLSSLDLAGHIYGPHSLEIADMLYHIDAQLKEFFNTIYETIPPEEVLITLTADHGVMPILEEVKRDGLTFAQRISSQAFINKINTFVQEQHGIKNFIIELVNPQLYVDIQQLNQLSVEKQNILLTDIKNYVLKQPGIQNAWLYKELEHVPTTLFDLTQFYKNQQYKGRTGQIIFQTEPYHFIDQYSSGTAHGTPYNYDTHVPLMMYQKGFLEKKIITDRVLTPQITVTLAQLLRVPRPSASTSNLLPGIPWKQSLIESNHHE